VKRGPGKKEEDFSAEKANSTVERRGRAISKDRGGFRPAKGGRRTTRDFFDKKEKSIFATGGERSLSMSRKGGRPSTGREGSYNL